MLPGCSFEHGALAMDIGDKNTVAVNYRRCSNLARHLITPIIAANPKVMSKNQPAGAPKDCEIVSHNRSLINRHHELLAFLCMAIYR